MNAHSLSEALPPLDWPPARLQVAAHFILAVLKLGTVNLARLANIFDTAVQADSNYKRLQRFFRHFDWDSTVLARWLASGLEESGWVVAVCDRHTPDMLKDYARRWEIETLFACLKIRGFDLESTHMTQDGRIAKLLALLGIAFVWCYRVGEWQVAQKPTRTLKHGRQAKTILVHDVFQGLRQEA